MSPITKISGCPGTVRSLCTLTRPVRSVSAVQPLSGGRGCDARGPDHGPARDALAGHDDAVFVDPLDAVPQSYFDPEPLEPRLRGSRELLRERAEYARRHVDQDDARGDGIDPSELGAQRGPHQHRQRAGHLDPGRSGADEDERQEIAMPARILLGLRLLERPQNSVSDRDGVREALQAGRELLELLVPEVAVPHAGRQDQVVVRERYVRAIGRARADATPVLVDGGDFTHENGRIPLLAENVANGRSDLSRRELRRRDLVQQRLKEMVIRAVDQNAHRPVHDAGPWRPRGRRSLRRR